MQERDSDFIVPVPEEPEKKRHPLRRWLIFAAVALLVLAILLAYLTTQTTLLDGMVRSLRYIGTDTESRITYESYGVTAYAPACGGLAIASHSGVTLFSESGSQLGKHQAELTAPAIEGTPDALLLYDVGGSFFGVMSARGKLTQSGTVTGQLLDACLAENGALAVLSTADDARAVAEVYDANGALLYRRTSKTTYLNVCALSPDGGWLALATLGQQDIAFSSGVKLFRTNSEDEAAELSFGGQIIYDMKFLDGSTVCAVGSRSAVFFRTDGTLLGEYDYDGADLLGYTMDGSCVALTLDRHQAGSRYALVVLSQDGTARAQLSLSDAPEYLSAAGEYLAVLTPQTMTIYNMQLEEQFSCENGGWLRAFARRDGTALLAGSGEAELYIP